MGFSTICFPGSLTNIFLCVLYLFFNFLQILMHTLFVLSLSGITFLSSRFSVLLIYSFALRFKISYNTSEIYHCRCSSVAEQLFRKQQVVGSIPPIGSQYAAPI